MEKLFISILSLSISAGFFILAVIAVRILLRKAPKNMICLLWLLVGIRLLIPFSIESAFGMAPNTNVIDDTIMYEEQPAINSGYQMVDRPLNRYMQTHLFPNTAQSVNPLQLITILLSRIWLAGMMIMLGYFLISWIHLYYKVKDAKAVIIEGDRIYQGEEIETPFLLGIVKPRIYVPAEISKTELPFILAHEKAHIKRRDYLIKPLFYLILMVYWFHPLVWVSYLLLCRDIELACDESVIKKLGADYKKAYSQALLDCSVNRRTIAACPVAFGEVGIRQRIKNILNYKKPGFWIIVITILLCVVISMCFLTQKKPTKVDRETVSEEAEIVESDEVKETSLFHFTLPDSLKETVRYQIQDYKTIVFTDKKEGNELGILCALSMEEAVSLLREKEYVLVGNYGSNAMLESWLSGNVTTHSYQEDSTTYLYEENADKNEINPTDEMMPPGIPNAEGTYYAMELEEKEYLPNEKIKAVQIPSDYCYVLILTDAGQWQTEDIENLKRLQEELSAFMKEVQVEEILQTAKPTVDAFLNQYAGAYCNRDGETIMSLLSEEAAASLEEKGILDAGENYVSFGFSSPWPMDAKTDYKIADIQEHSAQILYYAWTSDPHYTVWCETLNFEYTDTGYQITKVDTEYLDGIDNTDAFLKAYPNKIIDNTRMDYLTNEMGEALNNNAISQKDSKIYNKLFEPGSAACLLLNISEDDNKIGISVIPHNENRVHVSITFTKDLGSVFVDMIQPYGTDGIWIPQTCNETIDFKTK